MNAGNKVIYGLLTPKKLLTSIDLTISILCSDIHISEKGILGFTRLLKGAVAQKCYAPLAYM
jgi:hypothetical protein